MLKKELFIFLLVVEIFLKFFLNCALVIFGSREHGYGAWLCTDTVTIMFCRCISSIYHELFYAMEATSVLDSSYYTVCFFFIVWSYISSQYRSVGVNFKKNLRESYSGDLQFLFLSSNNRGFIIKLSMTQGFILTNT